MWWRKSEQAPMFIPEPEVQLVFQDHHGDRFVVVAVGKHDLEFIPLGREDGPQQPMGRRAWRWAFEHQGWLTI